MLAVSVGMDGVDIGQDVETEDRGLVWNSLELRNPPSQRAPLRRPLSPQWSITTLRSLDISSNIPKLSTAMDAEDSPWGGA